MYIRTYCTSQLQGFRYILFGQDFSFTISPPHIRTRRKYLNCQRGEGWVNGRSKCLDKVAMSTAWSRKNCDKNICMSNSSPFSDSCHLFSLFFRLTNNNSVQTSICGHSTWTHQHTHTQCTHSTHSGRERGRQARTIQFNLLG